MKRVFSNQRTRARHTDNGLGNASGQRTLAKTTGRRILCCVGKTPGRFRLNRRPQAPQASSIAATRLVAAIALTAVVIPVNGTTGIGEATSSEDVAAEERHPDRSDWELILAPSGDPYPPSIAGPHQRGSAISFLSVAESTIADTGTRMFGLKLGGRFGVLGLRPRNQTSGGWQVGLEAGFYGQFDVSRDYDNVGWDGFYGVVATGAIGSRGAFKLGSVHTSSHVGDEYEVRTGRSRIDYSRQEAQAGLSWRWSEEWRSYGEAGWGYDLRSELQEPGRVDIGHEYEVRERLWNNRVGWYAALDLSAFEERRWQIDSSLQAGFVVYAGERRWRLGIEYYDGRAPLGEFFQDDQRYIGIGLWLDP